jgi:hypothetical protein
MIARRVKALPGLYPYEIETILKPGEYCRCEEFPELWIIMAPNGDLASINNPSKDPSKCFVEEHEDGTISIQPASIQFRNGKNYHGYLKHDVWT